MRLCASVANKCIFNANRTARKIYGMDNHLCLYPASMKDLSPFVIQRKKMGMTKQPSPIFQFCYSALITAPVGDTGGTPSDRV